MTSAQSDITVRTSATDAAVDGPSAPGKGESPHDPRFDPPPPQPATANLDGVLDGVENLAQGIDAMLRAASTSSVASVPPAPVASRESRGAGTASTSEEPGSVSKSVPPGDDEDEIMRVFDEDTPSDIHAIDRMLARQAEELVQQDGPLSEDDVAADDDLLMLAPLAGVAPAHRHRHARHVGQESDVLAVIGEPAFADVTEPSRRDTGDAGEAVSLARSASAETSPVAAAMADGRLRDGGAVSVAGEFTGIEAEITPRATEFVQSQSPVIEHPATAHASPLVIAVAARAMEQSEPSRAPVATPSKPQPRRSATASITVVRATLVQTLTVINLPLHALPTSMRPTVNVLALTLALWAPAVWLLAPRLAERAAAMAVSATIDQPSHQESGLHDEAPPSNASQGSAAGHH